MSIILERKMRDLPTIQDVNSNLQVNTPQVNVEIDRKQASALGVSIAQIQSGARRRFRLATAVDHLHADQRVSGDPGGQAGIPADPNALRSSTSVRQRASWFR